MSTFRPGHPIGAAPFAPDLYTGPRRDPLQDPMANPGAAGDPRCDPLYQPLRSTSSTTTADPAGAGTAPAAYTPTAPPPDALDVPQPGEAAVRTPSAYMNLYRNLRVRYWPAGPDSMMELTADPHIYVNERLRASGRGANLGMLNEILERMRVENRYPGRLAALPFEFNWSHRGRLRPAFNGVGRPRDLALVLEYALAIGQASPADLAQYCDVNPKLGVECTGFVSNFMIAIGRYRDLKPITYYGLRCPRRSSLDSADASERVQPLDVLFWRPPSGVDPPEGRRHIAIIEEVHAPQRQLTVVESSGSFGDQGGLHMGRYTIRGIRGTLFDIDRGPDCRGSRTGTVSIHGPRGNVP